MNGDDVGGSGPGSTADAAGGPAGGSANAGGPGGGGGAPRASAVRQDKGPAPGYLAGLRTALADLPASEVAEILDDVGAHLADVVADIRADGAEADMAALTARLGTPADYAAELRAAAGYPPRPVADAGRPGVVAARLAVIGLVGSTLLAIATVGGRNPGTVLLTLLVGLVALPAVIRDGPRMPSVAALPEVRRFLGSAPSAESGWGRIVGFAAALQPAWWLLRALVATLLVVAVFGGYGGEGIVAVVLVGLVAIPISVWLGGRSRRDRRLLWVVVPLNAVAAALTFVGALSVGPGPSAFGDGGFAQPTSSVAPPVDVQEGLWQDGQRQIRDIHPVDSAGVPLTGVYLFDQEGRVLDTGGSCPYGYDFGEPTPDPARPYPRGVSEPDPQTGRCVTTPPAPLVVAVPAQTPTPPATAPLTTAPLTTAPPTSAPVPATPTR